MRIFSDMQTTRGPLHAPGAGAVFRRKNSVPYNAFLFQKGGFVDFVKLRKNVKIYLEIQAPECYSFNQGKLKVLPISYLILAV